MRWLWLLLRRLFAAPRRRPPDGRPAAPPRPQRIEDHVALLRGHAGARSTALRILDGPAVADNVLFQRERIETEDDEGNARQVDIYRAPTDSFGHLLDQNVRPTSLCFGGELMCSTEGCQGWCGVCGAWCCARHRWTYRLRDGTSITYCLRHRWPHFWRRFWGLYQ